MKNKDYRNSRLKYQLLDKKRNGVREVIWKINTSQKEFIENSLGFQAEPYLYEVQTKRFYNVHNLDGILREIHYRNMKGKKTIVFKLIPEQMALLDRYNIRYRPYKYRIKLN